MPHELTERAHKKQGCLAKQPDVGQATRASLLSLQACSRMVWTGWLGWIPRSGLPSHIHTQNVCGTVNHFFKYRMTAGTAARRLVSARLPQDTSSGMVFKRSSSWSLLAKSCLDSHVTEAVKSMDPRKHYGLLPRDGKSAQGRAQQRKREISHHAAKTTCHIENHLFQCHEEALMMSLLASPRRQHLLQGPRGWI